VALQFGFDGFAVGEFLPGSGDLAQRLLGLSQAWRISWFGQQQVCNERHQLLGRLIRAVAVAVVFVGPPPQEGESFPHSFTQTLEGRPQTPECRTLVRVEVMFHGEPHEKSLETTFGFGRSSSEF